MELLFRRCCSNYLFRYYPEKDKDVRWWSCSFRYGVTCLSLAYSWQRSAQHVGAWLVLHQKGRYYHPSFNNHPVVLNELRMGRRQLRYAGSRAVKWQYSFKDWFRNRLDLHSSWMDTGRRRLEDGSICCIRSDRKGKRSSNLRSSLRLQWSSRRWCRNLGQPGCSYDSCSSIRISGIQPSVCTLFRSNGRY